MNIELFQNKYWNQYMKIEEEFVNTFEYVDCNKDNYLTFSNEYVKILLQAGSEIDVLMRMICNFNTDERSDIVKYAKIILDKYPKITSQNVEIINGIDTLVPYENWNVNKAAQSLTFWEVYNNVKHNRVESYKLANLKNTISCLAAMFILEMYVINDMYIMNDEETNNYPEKESQVFALSNWPQHIRVSKIKSPHNIIDDDDGTSLF